VFDFPVSITLSRESVLVQIQVASTLKVGTDNEVMPCLTTAAGFCL
jgi:hypothetical protein